VSASRRNPAHLDLTEGEQRPNNIAAVSAGGSRVFVLMRRLFVQALEAIAGFLRQWRHRSVAATCGLRLASRATF